MFITILSIIILISSVKRVYNDKIFEEKSLSHSFMQTIVCVMLLFVGILTIIYYFKMKKHQKEPKE